jgi:hypothetical protein
MLLVDRVDAGGHSIRRFRAAASLRYEEGLQLASEERRLASVYLCGYCAEMLLKAAYFRLIGFGETDRIQLSDMYNARNRANSTFAIGWTGNLHDLPGWNYLLIEEHRYLGAPLNLGLRSDLSAHISRIHVNWREYLRYHPNQPTRRELERVVTGATWLRQQFRKL